MTTPKTTDLTVYPRGTDVPRIEATCPVCDIWMDFDPDSPPEDYETYCPGCRTSRDMIILRIS